MLKQILKCPESYEVSQPKTERIKNKKSQYVSTVKNPLRKIESVGGFT